MTSPRGYDAGTAILQIIPVFKGVQERIEREVKGVERALGRKSGEEFGKNFEEGTNKAVDRVLGTETAKKAARKAGEAYAGAFSDQLKKAIGNAQREIRSTIKITGDDKDVQRTLRGISNELNKISKAKIGVDLDAGTALAQMQAVAAAVKDLQKNASRIDLGVNTATAQASLEKVEKQLRAMENLNIEVELDERKMGLFEKAVKRRLQAAVQNIPPVEFDADVTPAMNKVQKLRFQMAQLLDKRIGIDADGSSVLAEMEKIRAALASVGGDRELDIAVRTDAASAAKELSQIKALVELVDGSTAKVEVDINSNTVVSKMEQLRAKLIGTDHAGRNAADSFRSFNAVILAGAAILPAAIPALTAAAGAMLLMGPAALAAAAGLGALIFGFSGIGDAVSALGKQQETAGRDATQSARTMRDAAKSVSDAERGLADARTQAGRASQAAAAQVEDAIDSQRRAEQDLVRAQADVIRAQEGVNRAREEARERIEDLSLSIRGGALAEREAVLDLADAQRAFNEAQASGEGGTALERLRIDLEQARLRVDQLRESNQDMAQEQAEFNRTGIDGSREVKSAQEQLASAQQGVADAMARVADASEGVQDALADQARTNADNSRLIEDAQRAVTDAQQRYNDALYDTGVAGSTAAQAVSEAFAKLGPAGQRFAIFIDSIRGQMRDLRDEVQAGLLPGVEDSISRILSVNGPLLQTFMRNMGNTLGNLFREFGVLMTSPQWQGLWATFNDYAPTFVEQFGRVAFAMLTFFGELFQGLAPYAERFGDALVRLADRSADWMATFTNSQTFQDIMDWLFENGPVIFDHLVAVARAAVNLIVALEPLGMVILGIIGNIADFIAELDPKVLGVIVTTILGLVIAFQLASGAVALFTGATNVLTGKLSRIVFFFGAAATALTVLYTQSEPVRAFFDWLFGILGDVIGWFADLPGPIQLFAGALGAIALLRGPLAGLFEVLKGVSLIVAGGALKGLTESALALSSPKGALAGVRSAGGRLVSFFGGPWMIALAGAVTGLTLLYDWLDTSSEAADNAKTYQERLAAALRESKGAIDENVEAQAAQALVDAEIGDSNALRVARDLGLELPKVTDALLGNAEAYEQIRDHLNAIIDESLLAENAGDLEWTKKAEDARLLLEVLDALAPSMGIVTENADLLAEASGGAAVAQGNLASAAERVNTAMAIQNQHLLDLTEADMAFSESTSALADAQTRVAEAQEALNAARESGVAEDIAAAERGLADALAGVEQQSYDTATAAGRLAEKRFANAEGEDLQLLRDAAILENLREQERLYGTLPPRLQELKDGLEANVPAAYQAAVQMANLGLEVESIPSDKTIVISGDTPQTQLDTLRDLGLEIVTLEDGSFAVTANTDEAQEILDNFLAQDLGIEIAAGVRWEGTPRPFEGHSGRGGFNTGGGHAAGGYIRGPGTATSDSIPAWLSNGEYVIKAESVQKYGLGLLHMINAGQYALGGLVKAGRQRFAGGGLAATWGGTMTLGGGDTNPLAQIWFEAVQAINAAAAAGAAVISAQFASMRDRVLGTIRDLRTRAMAEFAPMVLGLIRQTTTMRTLIDRQILTMSLNAIRTFTGMRTALNRLTLDLSLAQVRTFTGMRTAVEATVRAMVGALGTHFARLPRLLATPVNAVIDRVLNRGLFAAFNRIVIELGLNKEWSIAPAAGVQLAQTGGGTRLATGGRVPGFSPNDKADNIPAWLTAGEWVHPVDAVRYYGPDLMEKIRRRKIPREQLAAYADGGEAQRRASGGQIFAKTLSVFPRAKLNSGYRPGDPGYHGRDMAADLGEAGFAGGIGRAYIAAMKRWWVDTFGRTAQEIIYNGLGNDRTNINNGRPFPYSASTQADHRNHLHVAYAGVLAGATGGPGGAALLPGTVVAVPAWYSKYGSPAGVLKVLQESVKAADALKSYGKPGLMYDGMADKAVEYVWSKAKPQVESLFAGMAGQLAGAIAPASGASGPIVDIVRSVAQKYGWSSGNEWNSLVKLIEKESSFRNTAQNPTSTAYGLFQFLNSTWGTVGGYKTSDPGLQTEFGLRYIRGRYGTPSQALAFHLANNWYSEGGEVGADANAEAPTLYDTGGWLPPGLTTVLNATNKPEPILTSEQWADLTRSRGDSAPGNVIGALHLHQVQNDLEDAVAEVNHWATVYEKQGGRYATTGGRG